jgi:hypothetical protein
MVNPLAQVVPAVATVSARRLSLDGLPILVGVVAALAAVAARVVMPGQWGVAGVAAAVGLARQGVWGLRQEGGEVV